MKFDVPLEDDELLSGDSDLEIDIDGIDEVFEAADQKRMEFYRELTESCNVENTSIGAGGVKQSAFWGWDFFIYTNGAAAACTIQMEFERGEECTFKVMIAEPVSEEEVEEWFVTGSCESAKAVETAFGAFQSLLLEIAQNEPKESGIEPTLPKEVLGIEEFRSK